MTMLGSILSNAAVYDTLTLGAECIMKGSLSLRPAAGTAGRLYWITDPGQEKWTRDNGLLWETLTSSGGGGGMTVESHIMLVLSATPITM